MLEREIFVRLNVTYEASNFRDCLLEMGCAAESENSYVLLELEGKLCTDDYQKCLESMGDVFYVRKVEDFVKWLELQWNLRRISNASSYKLHTSLNYTGFTEAANFSQINTLSRPSNCDVCYKAPHHVALCPVFKAWSHNDKWEFVKRKRLCFQCLKDGHQRVHCTAPKCEACERPHHNLLHNNQVYAQYGKAPENTEERTPPFNNNIASVEIPMINNSGNIDKCFLPGVFCPFLNQRFCITIRKCELRYY